MILILKSILAGVTLLTLMAANAHAQLGELFVVQIGDGSASLTSGSTPTFVNRYYDDGAVSGATIAMPTAASGANLPLTNSGTASTEGYISLSPDGQVLSLAGYGAAPGMASIAGSMSETVPRVVGRISIGSGEVDTSTALFDAYNTSNIRSAVSDGVNVWTAGSAPSNAGGTRYATTGGTASTQISSSVTNTRVVDIFNGQLYVSSSSGAFQGISAVGTGAPAFGGETTTLLNGFPTSGTHSAMDFWFKDASTLYVADDSSAANGGGIQKWTESGGTWSLAYTLLNLGTSTTGVRGLTGAIDGNSDTVLFATTTQNSANRLIKVVDQGAGSTATDLATAPMNTVFRGVQFAATAAPGANNADFNNDQVVNGTDFLIWQRGFGLTGQTGKASGNANTDTVVDGLDFNVWKARFGGPPAVAASGQAPEPSTALLCMAGLLGAMVAGGRRRA